MTTTNGRTADHPVDLTFLKRWSPRAFDTAPIPDQELMTLFEAARWAPSAYNSQPWRFLYAHRDTPGWSTFLGLLNPFNQLWVQHASVLVVVLSARRMIPPGKDAAIDSPSHSLDTGAAWGYLALQAARMDIHAHAMVGFDFEAARRELGVPEDFAIECMIAIGRHGDPSSLPEPLRAREVPSPRRPIAELCAEGGFADLGPGARI